MIRRKLATAALVLALGTSGNAHAAVIVKTLELTASGFSGGGATIDPFTVVFSLNFDNSASFVNNSSGVTQIFNNAYGPLKIGYTAGADLLTLVGGNATTGFGGSCTNTALSFCSFITGISSANPSSNFVLQVGSDSGPSFASSVSVRNAAPVPEPAVWMTMLLGFGLMGAALRRGRAVVRTRVSYS